MQPKVMCDTLGADSYSTVHKNKILKDTWGLKVVFQPHHGESNKKWNVSTHYPQQKLLFESKIVVLLLVIVCLYSFPFLDCLNASLCLFILTFIPSLSNNPSFPIPFQYLFSSHPWPNRSLDWTVVFFVTKSSWIYLFFWSVKSARWYKWVLTHIPWLVLLGSCVETVS